MALSDRPGVKLGWLTEIASPDLARKKKIKKAASLKLQAPSSVDNGSGII